MFDLVIFNSLDRSDGTNDQLYFLSVSCEMKFIHKSRINTERFQPAIMKGHNSES